MATVHWTRFEYGLMLPGEATFTTKGEVYMVTICLVSAGVLAVLAVGAVLGRTRARVAGQGLILLVFAAGLWHLLHPDDPAREVEGLEYLAFVVVCLTAPVAWLAILKAVEVGTRLWRRTWANRIHRVLACLLAAS